MDEGTHQAVDLAVQAVGARQAAAAAGLACWALSG